MENYQDEELYLRAKKRVEKIKGFYVHLVTYIAVNIFLIAMVQFDNIKAGHFTLNSGMLYTPFFWGIGLAFHALGVFVFGSDNHLLGKSWENRKIKEFMEKDQQFWDENQSK